MENDAEEGALVENLFDLRWQSEDLAYFLDTGRLSVLGFLFTRNNRLIFIVWVKDQLVQL